MKALFVFLNSGGSFITAKDFLDNCLSNKVVNNFLKKECKLDFSDCFFEVSGAVSAIQCKLMISIPKMFEPGNDKLENPEFNHLHEEGYLVRFVHRLALKFRIITKWDATAF